MYLAIDFNNYFALMTKEICNEKSLHIVYFKDYWKLAYKFLSQKLSISHSFPENFFPCCLILSEFSGSQFDLFSHFRIITQFGGEMYISLPLSCQERGFGGELENYFNSSPTPSLVKRRGAKRIISLPLSLGREGARG